MDADPAHLLCGLAASHAGGWEPRQFTRFLDWHGGGRDGEPLLDLRADHQRWLVTPQGLMDAAVGRCLEFAAVAAAGDGFPGGLLVLAALHPARAPQILADMRSRGQWTAMSVGAVEHGLPNRGGDLWPGEVSLVRAGDQADEGALVVATGPDAVTAWELLTGSPPA